MATKNYIEYTDITHQHIGQFPSLKIQKYVDEANNELEDVALGIGLEIDNIVNPIPQIAKRYCLNYVTMRLAEDSIGSNNVVVDDSDMYKNMYEMAFEKMGELRPSLTYWILEGTAENNVELRGVRSTKKIRTS